MFGAFALKTIGATLKKYNLTTFFSASLNSLNTQQFPKGWSKNLDDSAVFYQQIPSVQFETRTQQVVSRWLVS